MTSSTRRKFIKSSGLGLTGVMTSTMLAHGDSLIDTKGPKEKSFMIKFAFIGWINSSVIFSSLTVFIA